jgi:hypothetical protein
MVVMALDGVIGQEACRWMAVTAVEAERSSAGVDVTDRKTDQTGPVVAPGVSVCTSQAQFQFQLLFRVHSYDMVLSVTSGI